MQGSEPKTWHTNHPSEIYIPFKTLWILSWCLTMWNTPFSVLSSPFSFAQIFVFFSVKMLGLSFLFRLLISILILKLNNVDFLVCAIGDGGAGLYHFYRLYQFLFLGSSKPWITATLETIPGKYSLNPHSVLTAFHQCQSETGYWGKLYQSSLSLSLSGISSHWVSGLFTGILCHVSFSFLPFIVWV